jgi:hypothetical protein
VQRGGMAVQRRRMLWGTRLQRGFVALVVVSACLLLILVRQRAAPPLPSLALRLAVCARARPVFYAVYVLGQGYVTESIGTEEFVLVVHEQTQLARNRDHAAASAAASHLGNVLCANPSIDFVQPDAGVRPACGAALDNITLVLTWGATPAAPGVCVPCESAPDVFMARRTVFDGARIDATFSEAAALDLFMRVRVARTWSRAWWWPL